MEKDSLFAEMKPAKALAKMDKQIPYHILFVLEYNGKYQLRIGYKESSSGENAFKVNKYYQTQWLDESEINISISGRDMDSVYEGFVQQIGDISVEDGKTLDEQIAANDQREKLMKEIDRLRAKIHKEKKFNRQVELNEKKFNRQVELNKQLKELLKRLEKL